MESKRKENQITKDCLLYRDNFLHAAEHSYDFLELVVNTITKENMKVDSIETHWFLEKEERGVSPDIDIYATNGKTYSIIIPETLDEKLVILVH